MKVDSKPPQFDPFISDERSVVLIENNQADAMATRKARLIDVARAAGVGTATVDRVVNGRGGVSAEKERRVLEAARALRLDRTLALRPTSLLRVAVVLQSAENPFYEALRDGFRRAEQCYRHLNVSCRMFSYDVNDPAGLLRLLERASGDADAMILVGFEHSAVNLRVSEFARSRPLVTLATDLPQTGRAAYVGPDNRVAGCVAGELMGRFVGQEGGEILLISGLSAFRGHMEREMGFRSVLAQRFPGCRIAAFVESRELRREIGSVVARELERHPELRGIYNISAGNRYIAEALAAAGRASEIVFISHELTDTSRRLLREGAMDAVIDQAPREEAMEALSEILVAAGRLDEAQSYESPGFRIHLRENSY
jgi:LacI family transcriptional regulator